MVTKSTRDSKTDVVGNCYFVGMHMVCCHGPITAVRRVKVAEKTVWRGNLRGSSTFRVQARWPGEGGVGCYVDAEFGEHDQDQNPYLADVLGIDEVPAYRGVASFILNQAYVGNTSYVKPWSFLLERVKTFDSWYPEKASIRYHVGRRNPSPYYGVRRTVRGHGRPSIAISGGRIYYCWIGSDVYDENGNLSFPGYRAQNDKHYQVWIAETDLKGNNWKMKQYTYGTPKRRSIYQEYVRFQINENVMYFLWQTPYSISTIGRGGVVTAYADVDHEKGIDGLFNVFESQRTNFPGYNSRAYYGMTQKISTMQLDTHKGTIGYVGTGLSMIMWPPFDQFIGLSHGCTYSPIWCFNIRDPGGDGRGGLWYNGPRCASRWYGRSFAGCYCFYDHFVDACTASIKTSRRTYKTEPKIMIYETGDGLTPTVMYFSFIERPYFPYYWKDGEMIMYPNRIIYGLFYETQYGSVYIERKGPEKKYSSGQGVLKNSLSFAIDRNEYATCNIECKKV